MKHYFLLLPLFFLLVSCDDDPVESASVKTIHLAGSMDNQQDGGAAAYWRDGQFTPLGTGSISSTVSSLSLNGQTVVMGGSKRAANLPSKSVVWVNGSETVVDSIFGAPMIESHNNTLSGVFLGAKGWVVLKNNATQPMADTAYSFGPMAMTSSGNDLYIAGYSSPCCPTLDVQPPQHAQYWKNTQLVFRDDEASNALGIYVHQGDVYMAGVRYPSDESAIACYWKNGQRTDLTEENGIAVARSIFVTDQHVYVAGMVNDQAVYWKDGELIALTSTGNHSVANSIVVDGTDVHVGGSQNGFPAYWMNDVRQDIDNQDKPGKILFVAVSSN